MAANILTAKPYSFLDDAPLEERRTQAVFSRRWLDAGQAKDLAALDPAAIQRVVAEAWPDPRNADELLDALDVLGFMTAEEGQRDGLLPYFQQLCNTGRATRFEVGAGLWVSPARLAEHRLVQPEANFAPPIHAFGAAPVDRQSALRELVRSRIEALGPVSAHEIAEAMYAPISAVERALHELEAEGVVFKGQFRPKTAENFETAEWCERRLLARIHRATLDRLRSEIEPVTQQDFMRFLLRWQRVEPEHRAAGVGGLASVLEQLEGYEAAAVTWESELLPSRLDAYDPFWLDTICLSGRVSWLRRSPGRRSGIARVSTSPQRSSVKATPVTLVQRARVSLWRALSGGADDSSTLSSDAESLRSVLMRQGASFYDDLERDSGLLRSRAEDALAELVTRGQATSDAFGGLRALLIPASQREAPRGRRNFSPACYSLAGAGRWTLLDTPAYAAATEAPALLESEVEALARVLLKRWGVVFRAMIEREGPLPPWRELLRCYRRLEARGEVRGGRFVAGFSGEQYALPEAVSALRDTRRAPKTGANVIVSGSDPLNLVGVIAPGRRVPAHAGTRILYRDGIAVAAQEGTTLRSLFDEDATNVARDVVEALTRRRRVTPTSRVAALALR